MPSVRFLSRVCDHTIFVEFEIDLKYLADLEEINLFALYSLVGADIFLNPLLDHKLIVSGLQRFLPLTS